MEGRARIEGVAASIHESYMDCYGNKVAEDAVFTTPCVVIIFDNAPRYRGHCPTEATDQASENDSDSRQSEQSSRDAGGDTSTNKICRSAPRAVMICLARR